MIIIIIRTLYLPSLQISDLIRDFKKKKNSLCGSPNQLPILENLGQVAGLIVMKISVMLK